MHATVSWLGSIVLRLGLTDESGQFKLTNAITPSVQPVIDCYFPAVIGKSACYGGDAQTVAECDPRSVAQRLLTGLALVQAQRD